jgi:hypothetical protein
MLDQAPIDGGLQFGAGLVVHGVILPFLLAKIGR